MLAMTVSICRSCGGPLSSLIVRASRLPVGRQLVALLEFLHRFGELGVVFQIGRFAGEAELVAQQRHARVFHRRFAG